MHTVFSRPQLHRMLVLTVAGIIGMVSAVAVARPQTPASPHLLTLRPAPATLDDLVAQSQTIVIGTVGPLVQAGASAGYDDQGKLITAAEKGLPPEAEVAYFDYSVQVEQILKDDGTVQVGQPVILRLFSKDQPGTHTGDLEFPSSAPGDRHLFFLDQNPDQATYGLWFGPASRLRIDGPIVRQSDGKQTPVHYHGEQSPADFMRTIREIVQQQKKP